MRLSRFFLPILKENPKEAEIVSHRLMLRAGMMRQEAAGIYAWLPLGFRVLKKIEQIVREEQYRAGALELLMPTLQLAEIGRLERNQPARLDAYDLLLRATALLADFSPAGMAAALACLDQALAEGFLRGHQADAGMHPMGAAGQKA